MIGPLCALLSSFTWAAGTTGYSRLAREHSAFSVSFARGFVAFPLFVLAAILLPWLTAGSIKASVADFSQLGIHQVLWFFLSMICSYAFGDVLFLWSTRELGVPVALTIASSYPLLTAAGGALVLGEALSLPQLAGLLITVGGVATVILTGARGPGMAAVGGGPSRPWRGVGLALLTSLFWAVNSFAVSEGGKGVTPSVGNCVRMAIAMVFCALFGKLFCPARPIFLPWADFRKWYWLFAFEGFAGSYFFLYGLSHSRLAIGSTLASVAPVISVPIALALGVEKFSLPRTAGVCSVVGGLWLLLGGMG
jgi:drug/metabolite transporter (DMT)-like permease